MMTRNEFYDYVKDNVKDYLPPSFQDAEISLMKVTKQNDQTLTGISIRRDGEQIVPNLYLEPYYKDYCAGEDPDKLVGAVADQRIEYDKEEIPEEFKIVSDYENVKDRIQIVLCDPEMNQERLKNKPSKQFGEFTATYQVMLRADEESLGTVSVTDSLLQYWGITPEQLHADAIAAEDARIPSLYNMNDLMMEFMTGQQPENLFQNPGEVDLNGPPLFCLTTGDKMFGASLMVREDILSKAAELLGDNFFILPSSLHEVLIIPESLADDAHVLVQMVKDVNEAEVLPKERLSDKVQFYDRESGVLENALKRQDRLTAEKEAAKADRAERNGGKRSIHDRLSEKRAAVQTGPAPVPQRDRNKSSQAIL